MIGTKDDIEKHLVFEDSKAEFILLKLPLKAPERSLAQNATFHKCFGEIGSKMGECADTIKQNCMKALFGITKTKFGGVWYENANISSTKDLKIDQASLLIDTLIEFAKKLGMGTIITSREKQAIFNNNNLGTQQNYKN